MFSSPPPQNKEIRNSRFPVGGRGKKNMSWPIRILGESGEEKLSCVDSKNIPLNYIIFF